MHKRLAWKPITKLVATAAHDQGHILSRFEANSKTPNIKMADCETCGAVCWIAFSPTRGFTGGGRAAKYACGTPEAMGMLRTSAETW